MFARTLKSTAALALLTLTAACSSGGGGSAGPADRVVPPGNFKPVSCAQDSVGAAATYANAGKIDRASSGFFGKFYNRPDLESVLDASILSTAIYGSQIKADITGVTISAQSTGSAVSKERCLSYSFLPDASEKQVEIWNEQAKAAGGGGTLQGLYYNSGGPKIIILRGSDRWTLVHELMHYNFDASRIAQRKDTIGTLDARIKRSAREFDKAMAGYVEGGYRRDLTDAGEALETMIVSRLQINVDSMLEEVAIEAMLIEKWSKGLLTNVSENSPKSGVWYIIQSKETALADFKDYGPLLDKVEAAANENAWPDIADRVKKNREIIAALSTRIDEIVAKAKLETGTEEVPGSSGPELGPIAAAYTMMTNPHVMMMANSPENRANRRDLRRLADKYGAN